MTDTKTEKKIVEQKCPDCGAPLEFSPETGLLQCPFCGYSIEIEEEKPAQTVGRKEHDAALAKIKPLPIYHCVSCGAEVIAEDTHVALTCPYCANNIVLTEQVSGTLKPDGIVPFRFPSSQLEKNVNAFYKGKSLLPKNFFSESRTGKVTGVYVPFWVYDCSVSGHATYQGEKAGRSHREGDYRVTEYDVYDLHRSINAEFRNLPVDASKKMKDALMDSLEPFDMADVKPFDVRYLSGYVADRFDQSSEEMRQRADGRVAHTAMGLACSQATGGYSGASEKGNRLKIDIRRARYILLPVYMFNVSYNNRRYSFAVNGQTGKVVGELPIDAGKKKSLMLSGFAAGAGVVLAILYTFFR